MIAYTPTVAAKASATPTAGAAPQPVARTGFIPFTPSQPVAPVTPTAAPASKGLVGSIKNAFAGGVDQIKQGIATIKQGAAPLPAAEAGLNIESGIASAVTSPLAPLFAPVDSVVKAAGNAIGSIPAVQRFALSNAGKITARIATDVGNAANVAGTITGADSLVKTAPKIATAISDTAKTIKGVKAATLPPGPFLNEISTANPVAEKSVIDSFNKAVKPTTAGKTGPGQIDAFHKSVVSAIKSIATNKDNLTFSTEDGPTETGRLPQTRGELADSVAQTKQTIFKQYDALAKTATGQGVQIPLEKAGTALDEVINSEALKLTNPGAVSYAKDMQTRLQNADGTYKAVTPDIAQSAIANWNASLKAFYRNPTYESASRAAIDAGVVTQLRESLDDAINNATGSNYQELKHQYGALSSIEKDVNKAAIAHAKQVGTNVSGLGKYVDVFSGGDMVSGLLSLNPALFVKGAAQSGISHFFQWLNSPDRAVSTMFKAAIK